MQTAMQELIDELELIDGYPMMPLILRLMKDRLEKEKEQICNAYTDGLEGHYVGAEKYYDKIYNKKPKKEYHPSEKYLNKQKELMEDSIWNKMNKNK